jgi:sugar phosphate isomerase/epimerase
MATHLTLLNCMLGQDFEQALDRHVQLGLKFVDLRDAIYGKWIMDLTDTEAARAAGAIRARGLSVCCLSTGLFCDDVERGEAHFREKHLAKVSRLGELARALRPRFVRLLSARFGKRAEIGNATEYLQREHPWVVPLYGEAVDRLATAGAEVTIENEAHGVIFANPAEIRDFFKALGRREKVCLTWDIQNMWQMGTFPTLEVYAQLRDLIGYVHVKGGRCAPGTRQLKWKSSLADASWPVAEIIGRVVADGVSPVICLNPPHGEADPSYDNAGITERDLEFMQSLISKTAGACTR